jgi:hypothetical protein
LTFCKDCGANLFAVRQVVEQRPTKEKFDWSKTWVAKMFQSSEEAVRRQQALELARGLTPEVKRYNEIKAGVITGSVGLALMIFLFVFMQGLIIGIKAPSETAAILGSLWVAGVIPLFVGLALIFNSLFVSKKMLDAAKGSQRSTSELPGAATETPALRSGNTTEFIPANLSVTEGTTRHLSQKEESR